MLLANVPFIPELFLAYQQELNQDKSGFFRSGIIAQNAAISAEFAKGGRTITIPHFNDLAGGSEILSDTTGLTAANLGGNTQIGVRNLRGRAWQSSDLAAELAGDDPMRAIAIRTGEYWVRDTQTVMISILNGLFGPAAAGGALAATHLTGGLSSTVNAVTMIDAIGKLGDAGQDLSAVAMDSSAYYSLIKKDLIVPGSSPVGAAQIDTRVSGERAEFGTYLGRPVIVDDGLKPAGDLVGGGTGGADVHTIYFFAPGAMMYAEVAPKTPVETDRDILKGIEVLVNRKEFLLHPVGLSWVGTAAGNAPTNTEFANVSNWSDVFEDPRNIKITALRGIL
jgi:hypothetical protein